MRYLTILSVLLLFVIPAHAGSGSVPNAPHISVEGKHEVKVTPDTLTLFLEIIEISRDANGARTIVEQRSTKLINKALAIGVEKKDINSAALSLNPKYNWQKSQQIYTGTEVSRKVQITLRDLSKYDQLIKAVLDANVARINNSQLSYSKESETKAKALKNAVTDAKARAEMLIDGLPQVVGNVYSIEAFADRPMPHARAAYQVSAAPMMEADAVAAFEPGTINFTQSVRVVFYLLEK